MVQMTDADRLGISCFVAKMTMSNSHIQRKEPEDKPAWFLSGKGREGRVMVNTLHYQRVSHFQKCKYFTTNLSRLEKSTLRPDRSYQWLGKLCKCNFLGVLGSLP